MQKDLPNASFVKLFKLVQDPALLIVYKQQQYKILEINQAYLDLTGFKYEDLYGKFFLDVNTTPFNNSEEIFKDIKESLELTIKEYKPNKISILDAKRYLNNPRLSGNLEIENIPLADNNSNLVYILHTLIILNHDKQQDRELFLLIKKLEETIRLTTKLNYPIYQGVFVHMKKSGEQINVDIKSSEITFKGKRAKLIVVNDITERLNYFKAIEQQNERLQEISWIQSHVVRAPLSRLLGLVYLLKNKIPQKEMTDEKIIEAIASSAEELDGKIREIVEKSDSQINFKKS